MTVFHPQGGADAAPKAGMARKRAAGYAIETSFAGDRRLPNDHREDRSLKQSGSRHASRIVIPKHAGYPAAQVTRGYKKQADAQLTASTNGDTLDFKE